MWTKSLIFLAAATICPVLAAQNQAAQDTIQLPDGPGKEIVQSACTKCHTLERVVATGYTRDGWQLMVNQMVSNGAKVTRTRSLPLSTTWPKTSLRSPCPPLWCSRET